MSERERDDAPIDLSPWAAPTPPRGIANRVMDAVRASRDVVEERPSTRPSASLRTNGDRWRGIALGFAGAAAAAAIAWAVWPRPRTSAPASGHIVAGAPSKVAIGDGTEAFIAAGAEVSWRRTGGALTVTQAGGEVTYHHAGPSRLVILTPHAEIHTARATLQVEVPMSSKSKVAVAAGAGAVAAAAVVIAVYEGKAEVREPTTSPRVVEAGTQVAVGPTSPTPPSPTFAPVAKATRDRAQRDALAAAIAAARANRAAAAAGAPPGGSVAGGGAPAPGAGGPDAVDLTPGQLSKDEIRTSVREVIPLLVDCYSLMLDKHPTVGGRVLARLVVEAEPDLGTIVTMQDDSEVDMRAANVDPVALRTDLADFNQCLGATLETIVLPPLGDKDGGRVEITYPFVFAPSEEEAEQYEKPPAPTQKRTARQNTPPAPPPPPGTSAEDLLADSESAAKTARWVDALRLSEQAFAVDGVTAKTKARAAMVAALAACNVGDARKAKRYYPLATPASRKLVEQRCLANGIDVD